MKEYERNDGKTPFRTAIDQADCAEETREGVSRRIHDDLNSLKKVAARSRKTRSNHAGFETALQNLQKPAEARDQELSKRWRATYDYVLRAC